MNVKIELGWHEVLKAEFAKPYFGQLVQFVRDEYSQHQVFPPGGQIFNAFHHCPFDQVKLVILGQDPYHGPGQAQGLCFSVNEGVPMPPSLLNIFKEIKDDLGLPIPPHGSLVRWARQGVLLLNATLTVRAHQAGSHQNKGWEEFTTAAVKAISDQKEHVVFMLWGNYALQKGQVIDKSRHFVLESAHPSPFAAHRGFFGNRHFSKANQYLRENGIGEISW